MTLHFSPDDTDIVARPSVKAATATPIREDFSFDINTPSKSGVYRSAFKRALDVLVTVLAAPIILPVVLVLALLISLDGRNPFYSQLRVGRGGKTFRIWKLRTMVHDADSRLESYLAQNPEARAEWDRTQKLKHDPRITLVGRVLRKSSLDELPQLFNVINGTMSLVGPRPMMLSQQDSYMGQAYYRLLPGITGLWQISDRNKCAFTGRVYYDEKYDREVSLKTDLSVLFKTFSVVARGTGY